MRTLSVVIATLAFVALALGTGQPSSSARGDVAVLAGDDSFGWD